MFLQSAFIVSLLKSTARWVKLSQLPLMRTNHFFFSIPNNRGQSMHNASCSFRDFASRSANPVNATVAKSNKTWENGFFCFVCLKKKNAFSCFGHPVYDDLPPGVQSLTCRLSLNITTENEVSVYDIADTHTSIFVSVGGIFWYWYRYWNNSDLDMKHVMVTDLRYRYILTWSAVLPGWKGFITVKWCHFLKLPDCFRCPFVNPLLIYPHYWWLFSKKCHWVNILWDHQ